MPTITLDASGAPKSAIVEGAYEFCGLNGFEYERTPEEMTSGLRKLNALMALLEKRGIDLGYQFPDYGAGLLQEPSGIPDDAVEPVTALLAQRLAPSLGATLSEDARAILSNALSQLMAHYAAAPLAIIPAIIMGGIGVRHIMRRRTVTTSDTTVTPTPVVSAVTPPPPPPPPPPPTLFPPVNSTLPIITGTTQKTQTLSCSTGSWTNSPTSFAYQWQRGGVAISGSIASTYVLTATDVAATITCVVSATNASGTTPQASAGVGPVIDLAPVNTIAPVASGTATVGQTLSVTTGTWTNSPTSYGYQWLRGGVAISGATSSTYLLVTGDNGTNITCTVTATNSGGSVPITSNTIGPIGSVIGTLSAPSIGYPSPLAANPATIVVHLPIDMQAGVDAIKLARSSSSSMASPTVLRYPATAGTYLSNADIAAGTVTLGLSGVSLSGITFFQAYGEHLGTDSSNRSNITSWGDTTAPVVTTSASQSITETSPLAVALTATDAGGIASWSIVGGADQLQFQIVGSTLEWFANGTQSYASPSDFGADNVYNVSVAATDYGGNVSSPLAIAVTVSQIDSTPTSFTFTNVSGAPLSTVETSNTVTIAGLQAGFNIPASLSGTGFTYSKNGGAYQSPGSFTVQNGDTLTLRVTSSSTNNMSVSCTVTVGTYSTNWQVSTPSAVVAGSGAVSGSFPGTPATFASQTLTAGYLNLFVNADYGRTVTSVVCRKTGQSDVTLTRLALNSSNAGQVWAGTIPVTASDWSVIITDGSDTPVMWAILPVTVSTSNTTPSQTETKTFANGTNSPFSGSTSFTIPSGGCAISFIAGLGSPGATQLAVTRTDGATTLATFNFVNFDGNKCAIAAHQMTANGAVTFSTVPTTSGGIDMIGLAYNA